MDDIFAISRLARPGWRWRFSSLCWVGYALFTEHESRSDHSLLSTTNRYRLQWMHEMLKRDNRTMDAITTGNLLRSITFFANTTIFILLGLMTMLGYHDRASAIIGNIPFAKPMDAFHVGDAYFPADRDFHLRVFQIHLVAAAI